MQIHNEAEHRSAITDVQRLAEAKDGTPEATRRKELLHAIKAYEMKYLDEKWRKGRPLHEDR
jgi:antitoxin component HigA of HigAB toxin-antitoxin module